MINNTHGWRCRNQSEQHSMTLSQIICFTQNRQHSVTKLCLDCHTKHALVFFEHRLNFFNTSEVWKLNFEKRNAVDLFFNCENAFRINSTLNRGSNQNYYCQQLGGEGQKIIVDQLAIHALRFHNYKARGIIYPILLFDFDYRLFSGHVTDVIFFTLRVRLCREPNSQVRISQESQTITAH